MCHVPFNLSGGSIIQPSASVPEYQEVSAMPNKHSLNLRVKTRDRAAIRFVPFIVDRYNAHKDSGIFIGHEANWARGQLGVVLPPQHLSYVCTYDD